MQSVNDTLTPAYAFSTVSATTAGLPAAVAPASPNVAVSTLTGADTAFVHWFDQSGDEDGFDVYRSTDSTFQTGVTLVGRTGPDENQYTAALPDRTDTFYYHVYAYRNDPPAGTSDDDNDGVEGQIALPADQPAGVPTPPGVAESTYSANTDQGSLALKTVQFGGVSAATAVMTSIYQASKIQPILRDNGSGAYDNTQPQWLDANADGTIAGGPSTFSDQTIDGKVEHQWPLSYERSQGSVPAAGDPNESKLSAFWAFMSATPTFAFAGQEPGAAAWEVEGLTNVQGMLAGVPGTKDPNKVITFGPGVLHQQGGTLSAYTVANQPLPNTIQSELMVITWQVSFDSGKSWVTLKVGTSKNWVYVTGGPAANAFQTVLWLGGDHTSNLRPRDIEDNSSDALRNDRAVVDGVWKSFSGNNTYRVDGTLMKYDHTATPIVTTAAGMLSNKNGLGQCTAWANLFVLTLAAEGESAVSTRIDPPKNAKRFAVVLEPAQGTGGMNYVTGTKEAGRGFVFHQVVMVAVYPNRIYDPSYGQMIASSSLAAAELLYEDTYITELLVKNTWISDVPGDPKQLIFTP